MTALRILTGLALAMSLVLLGVMIAQRARLAASERRKERLERELQPLALEIVYGDEQHDAPRAPVEQQALAVILQRYARQVAGSSRDHAARWFAQTGVVATQIAELQRRSAWRRATAAYALGDMVALPAVDALIGALEDPDPRVRGAAARSLGYIPDPRCATALLDAYDRELLPESVCGGALAQLSDQALPAVRAHLSSGDLRGRLLAVRLLRTMGDASDGDALAALLTDPSAAIRAAAAESLAAHASGVGVARLERLLEDRIPSVRAAAAAAIGRVGGPEHATQLVNMLGQDFETDRAAAGALARLDREGLLARVGGDPRSDAHLVEAADRLLGGR